MYLGQKAVLSVGIKAKQILLCCAAAICIHRITWYPAVQSIRLNARDAHQVPATQTTTSEVQSNVHLRSESVSFL